MIVLLFGLFVFTDLYTGAIMYIYRYVYSYIVIIYNIYNIYIILNNMYIICPQSTHRRYF